MKSGSDEAAVRDRLIEERQVVMTDIEELAAQLSSSEIDRETAGQLFASYSEDLGRIDEQIERLPPPGPPDDERPSERIAAAGPEQPASAELPVEDQRSLRRAVTGSLALVVVMTVAVVWIANASSPDPEPTSPLAPGALVGGNGTDQLNDASVDELAAIVDADPGSVAARLILADRYLELGENQLALEHYLLITAADPGPAEDSRASGRVGYLAYITGQNEAARDFLESAVALDPENIEAKLFLGVVLLYGFDDATAALPLLEEVAALPDLPDAVRTEVTTALQDARSAPGGG